MKRVIGWACLIAVLLLTLLFSGCNQEIVLEASLPSTIKDKDGEEILSLDRELRREKISIDKVPEHVIHAFIAIEDLRFYEHLGLDFRSIFRASLVNFKDTGNPFQGSQGGSTITQQLVKNTVLSPDRTLTRKIREAWLALRLERTYSKEEILEFYLNYATYFNHNNYGIQAASKYYFNKDVSGITLEEGALLAGIIRHPSRFSPYEHPEEARKRQQTVLIAMKEGGFISEDEYHKALRKDLEDLLAPLSPRGFSHPHFIDYVIYEEALPILRNKIGSNDLPENVRDAESLLHFHGLTIYTTMDRELQEQAEALMNDPGNFPATWEDDRGIIQPQGALIVSEPARGYIRAMVGGRDYGSHNMVNRAVSQRSPGSALKPIIAYAPALEERLISPASPLQDVPTTWKINGREYSPRNFTGRFSGTATARNSLARSLNVPAVKIYNDMLAREVGIKYAEAFGIDSFDDSDRHNPAAVLGGLLNGVKPVELNEAYASLANNGTWVKHHTVTRIEDRNGKAIYEYEPQNRVVVSEGTAWLVNDMLKDAVSYGTAVSLSLDFPVAAKTGTSQDLRDAWLIAYTPELVATCWIGYDTGNIAVQNRTVYTTGMVQGIMSFAFAEREASDFEKPNTIVGPSEICKNCGLLASSAVPPAQIVWDYFHEDMVPDQVCFGCSGMLPPSDPEEEEESEEELEEEEEEEEEAEGLEEEEESDRQKKETGDKEKRKEDKEEEEAEKEPQDKEEEGKKEREVKKPVEPSGETSKDPID